MNQNNTSQPVWSKEPVKGLTGVEKRTGQDDDRGFFESAEGLIYYFVEVSINLTENIQIARGPFLNMEDAKADYERDTTEEITEFLGLPKDDHYAHRVDGFENVQDLLKGKSIFKALALAAILGGGNSGALGGLAELLGRKRRPGFHPGFSAAYGKPRVYEKKENIHATIYGDPDSMFSSPIGRNYEELEPQKDDFAKFEGDDRILVHKPGTCGHFWHFDMVPDSGMIVGEFLTADDAVRSANEYARVAAAMFIPPTPPEEDPQAEAGRQPASPERRAPQVRIDEATNAIRGTIAPGWFYPHQSEYALIKPKIQWSRDDARLGRTTSTPDARGYWYFRVPLRSPNPEDSTGDPAIAGPFYSPKAAWQAMTLFLSDDDARFNRAVREYGFKQRVTKLFGDPANWGTNLGLLALLLRGSEHLQEGDTLASLATALHTKAKGPQWWTEGEPGYPEIETVNPIGDNRYAYAKNGDIYGVSNLSGSEHPLEIYGPFRSVQAAHSGMVEFYKERMRSGNVAPPDTVVLNVVVDGDGTVATDFHYQAVDAYRAVTVTEITSTSKAKSIVHANGLSYWVTETVEEIRALRTACLENCPG